MSRAPSKHLDIVGTGLEVGSSHGLLCSAPVARSWSQTVAPVQNWEEEGGRHLQGRVTISELLTPSPRSHRANAEIAQVRGKAQQEQAAYQASLRKEQLRVDALERTLEQKVTGRGGGLQASGAGQTLR